MEVRRGLTCFQTDGETLWKSYELSERWSDAYEEWPKNLVAADGSEGAIEQRGVEWRGKRCDGTSWRGVVREEAWNRCGTRRDNPFACFADVG